MKLGDKRKYSIPAVTLDNNLLKKKKVSAFRRENVGVSFQSGEKKAWQIKEGTKLSDIVGGLQSLELKSSNFNEKCNLVNKNKFNAHDLRINKKIKKSDCLSSTNINSAKPHNNNFKQRSFSYTDLQTQIRSNFKKSFEEVIKKKENLKLNKNSSTLGVYMNKRPKNDDKKENKEENSSDAMKETPKFGNIINLEKKSTNNTVSNNLLWNNYFIPLQMKVNITKTALKYK